VGRGVGCSLGCAAYPARFRISVMAQPVPCPIPKAHGRLADMYAIWHETLAVYPEPDAFRRRFNNLLQETRNVTFMLQTEKHVIPEFDAWYERWRAVMGATEVLKWSLDMRNQVVKRGDLEARSIARVSVLAAWDNPPAKEIEVPSKLGPEAIAQHLKHTGIPEEFLPDAVAIVERRWVVASLPEREALDALAECYQVLYDLVSEAHDLCGVPMADDKIEAARPTWTEHDRGRGRPAGMELSDELRTARLRLATGEWVSMERHAVHPSAEQIEASGKRWEEHYGGMPKVDQGPVADSAEDVFATAEWFVQAAKKVLAADRYHLTMTWTIGPDGVTQDIHRPEDRADKYILWNRLAEAIARRKDWGLVCVTEAWSYKGDYEKAGIDLAKIRGVEDIPGRGEELMVTAAYRDGQARMHHIAFTHSPEGQIVYGDESVYYTPGDLPNIFIPVMKVWQAQRQQESGKPEPLSTDSRPKEPA
jgi:hypothetical protein